MAEAIDAPGRDVAVRAADHHDQDPGRQDRRGHRAQGQDDQPDPGRDRRRDHHRGRRHDLHRRDRRPEGRGGPRDDQRDRQPDDARGRRALPRHRRQDDDLRRVRLAAARQGRPAAHLASCASSPAASGSRTSRTCVKVGDKIQVEIAEIDPRGKLSLVPVEAGDDAASAASAASADAAAPARRASSADRAGVASTTRTLHRADGGGGLVRRTVLPGGLRVVTEAMPTVRSVTVRRLGRRRLARRDDPRWPGASHYLEHLLFKGTKRRDALDISAAIDAVGGEMNAFTVEGVHLLLRAGARRRPAARGRRRLRHGHLVADPRARTSTPSAA